MKKLQRPLKLVICSWAAGIGGGAARMEAYYQSFYDDKKFDVELLSLIKRQEAELSFKNNLKFTQINTKQRFQDLVNRFRYFDVVQFQGSFDPLVCEAAKEAEVPLLIEVLHNIEEGSLFDNIDGTICVSKAIEKKQRSNANFITITNGIEIEDFPYQPKIRKKDDPITILQIGRRSKVEINLDELPSAILKEFPDTNFIICGVEQNLESNSNIHFKGVTAEVIEEYHNADIFILLSREEPFGLVALEAMACGIPTVVSGRGGFLEIIKDKVDGYLVAHPLKENATELIIKLIKEIKSGIILSVISAAREKVESKFNIKNSVKLYEDYILDLYDKKFGLDYVSPTRPQKFVTTPPNSMVGEALYDFHEENFLSIPKRLQELSLSVFPITEMHSLKLAHDLSMYIKINYPTELPKGIFPYLYFSGDRTQDTLKECIHSIEIIKARGLYESFSQDWKEFLKNHSQSDQV